MGIERLPSGHTAALPAGIYLRLCVHDTGFGVDEATLQQATDPFFHGLAAQLGGGLEFEIQAGCGTTVKIWLPVAASEAVSPLARVEPVVGPRSGTVVLVDDEDLVRASTADMLTDIGYRVVEAHTAEEALRKLDEESQVELLITDHLMPGMTGAELARIPAAKRPDLPVLLISGYAEAEGVGLEFARLTKPFRQAELATAVAELIDITPRYVAGA